MTTATARQSMRIQPHQRWMDLSGLLLIAALLVLASWRIGSNYSYELDELFAVQAGSSSWQELYSRWISGDVHPPVYLSTLKLWIGVFGNGELATRSFSLLQAGLTLLLLWRGLPADWGWKKPATIALVGANPSFCFFAQQVRPYSLAILLATAVTVMALRLRRQTEDQSWLLGPYYASALMLSLTHYFGLFYVGTLTLINLWERRLEPHRWRSLLFLALLAVWPLYQLLYGTIGTQTGGRFWVKVTPLVGTLNAYLTGCFPLLNLEPTGRSMFALALLLTSLAGVIKTRARLIGFLKSPATDLAPEALDGRFLLSAIGLMLLLLGLMDLHTPLSYPRYYSVLIPATGMVVAQGLGFAVQETRPHFDLAQAAVLALAAVIVMLLMIAAMKGLRFKTAPSQNWKAMAAFARATDLCRDGCVSIGGGLGRYYFGGLKMIPIGGDLTELNQRQSLWRDQGKPLLLFNAAYASLPKPLPGSQGLVCRQPLQSGSNHVVVLARPDQLAARAASKDSPVLRPCD